MSEIYSIYSRQNARIIVNGEKTNQCQISKGTYQGCPLSPLLFITTLEVLLRKIRKEKQVKGLKIEKQHFKLVRDLADDMVIFLEDPSCSIMKLKEIISDFGEQAGLIINEGKTNILTKI